MLGIIKNANLRKARVKRNPANVTIPGPNECERCDCAKKKRKSFLKL